MLSEAIYSLRDVQMKIVLPHAVNGVDVTKEMAKAVDAWTNWDFDKFGQELGTLLRGLVLKSFPREYSIDVSGRLQRDDSKSFGIASKQLRSVVPTIIAGMSVTFLF